MFGGFNMVFPDHGRRFSNTYKCFSVSMLPGNERQDVEKGGKIIMPPSALDQLSRLNVEYPMLFRLTNERKKRKTHAGVLEFIADEGKIYLPHWMMRNLLLEEGDFLFIENLSLPVATFSKFQPQNPDFLDITNPKAVLENALRNFACLTTGDLVAIKYNQRIYELCVLETRPGDAVTIIECDMNVEFEAPVGYKEPTFEKKNDPTPMEEAPIDTTETVTLFAGEGVRLDGKKKKDTQLDEPVIRRSAVRGVPDYDHPIGLLKFDRSVKPISDRKADPKANNDEDEDVFHGQGFSLKKGRK